MLRLQPAFSRLYLTTHECMTKMWLETFSKQACMCEGRMHERAGVHELAMCSYGLGKILHTPAVLLDALQDKNAHVDVCLWSCMPHPSPT